MVTRRDAVRSLVVGGTGMGMGLLAGSQGQPPPAAAGPAVVGRGGQVGSEVARTVGDPAAVVAAAGVVRAFGVDLYRHLSRSAGNLVCSPYSVAVALAMTRNGARGRTATEMDRVLHTSSVPRLNGGLGALELSLEKHSGPVRRADGSAAEVALRVANSLWGQRDLAWQTAFLDALARHYGAAMRLVDYRVGTEGARTRINGWTSEQTGGKIRDLVPRGVLDELTRLVLVNAVYLKAPWDQPFLDGLTRPVPFTRADGSTVDAPMMTAELDGARYGRADGWQAAEVRYAGNQLAMTVIVPDRGTFPAFERRLDGDRLAHTLQQLRSVQTLDLRLPKWTFRTSTPLREALTALGMPTAFSYSADFSGMTVQERLYISAVLHEAFIAVDESGTEAAAATAVVVSAVSAKPPASVTMVVDRPFLFIIHDLATATPVFLGRVMDPNA
jgi:serpin B